MSFDHIRVDDILAIHADQIELYGKVFPRTILLLMATSELHLLQPMYFWQLMDWISLRRMTMLKTLF